MCVIICVSASSELRCSECATCTSTPRQYSECVCLMWCDGAMHALCSSGELQLVAACVLHLSPHSETEERARAWSAEAEAAEVEDRSSRRILCGGPQRPQGGSCTAVWRAEESPAAWLGLVCLLLCVVVGPFCVRVCCLGCLAQSWLWLLCVRSVAFSPDGKQIVSGGGDRTVRVWDVSTGRELQELKGHTGGVRSSALPPLLCRAVAGVVRWCPAAQCACCAAVQWSAVALCVLCGCDVCVKRPRVRCVCAVRYVLCWCGDSCEAQSIAFV